jgi:hypothetical protein
MTSDGWDELERRSQESAEGGGVPAGWGSRVDLGVGESFRGRYRGREAGGKSGAFLLWDAHGQEMFIWSCASLEREFERENPNVGDDVVISRAENYRTRYDGDGDAPSGLSYGVAARENDSDLPSGDSEFPF